MRRHLETLTDGADFDRRLRHKHQQRLLHESVKPLQAYRDEELARMRHDFAHPDYHQARRRFLHVAPLNLGAAIERAWLATCQPGSRRSVRTKGLSVMAPPCHQSQALAVVCWLGCGRSRLVAGRGRRLVGRAAGRARGRGRDCPAGKKGAPWKQSSSGLSPGSVSLPLYVAYLNREGPGNVCSAIAHGGHSCLQAWNPWPWAAAGTSLVAVGITLFLALVPPLPEFIALAWRVVNAHRQSLSDVHTAAIPTSTPWVSPLSLFSPVFGRPLDR